MIKSFISLKPLLLTILVSQVVADHSLDINLGLRDIILRRNLTYEEHTILTEDGYYLKLMRIPGRLGDYQTQPGPPVLLQHGFIDSADAWVANDENSPAFLLSRAGYDVWLGNNRGNKYSRQHQFLSPYDELFWNYSFEELGTFDLTAMTNYILLRSKFSKIAYIGHSQGTTQAFWALVSNQQFFRDKWNVFIALAPPLTFQGYEKSQTFASLVSEPTRSFIINTLKTFKSYEIYPNDWFNNGLFKTICTFAVEVCKFGTKMMSDLDPELNNEVASQVFFSNFPSGSSLKCAEHFTQLVQNARFQRFDYGPIENQLRYGSDFPPEIDISTIQGVPIGIIAGGYDVLSNLEDTRWMLNTLPRETLVHYSEHSLGHLSYFTAKSMSYFTHEVMGVLEKYHKSHSQLQANLANS